MMPTRFCAISDISPAIPCRQALRCARGPRATTADSRTGAERKAIDDTGEKKCDLNGTWAAGVCVCGRGSTGARMRVPLNPAPAGMRVAMPRFPAQKGAQMVGFQPQVCAETTGGYWG